MIVCFGECVLRRARQRAAHLICIFVVLACGAIWWVQLQPQCVKCCVEIGNSICDIENERGDIRIKLNL